MFGRKFINGSIKWLVVPSFLRNDGPPWTLNLLYPYVYWGGRGSSTSQNLIIGYGGGIPTVFLSTGIGLLAFFQFITGGSLRTLAVLRVAPVTISLWRTARTACKSPLLVVNPSVVVWLTRGMMPWMIAEISLFVNNLCGEFMLVV